MQNPEKCGVQIIYTQIDRDAENRPSFKSFKYRVNPLEYFYMADHFTKGLLHKGIQ
jgi:hypothetical protein